MRTTEAPRHGVAPASPGRCEENLHRNNAAEWAMVALLWPVAWVLRWFGRDDR